jgi:hypothetical protein
VVVKTAKDVEKLQKQMSEQFERHIQAMRSGEGPATLLEDPQAAIEQLGRTWRRPFATGTKACGWRTSGRA